MKPQHFSTLTPENGELGLGGIEDEQVSPLFFFQSLKIHLLSLQILVPRKMQWEEASQLKEAALGVNHTLFLMEDGRLFACGSNDHGNLGFELSKKRPRTSLVRMCCQFTKFKFCYFSN